MDCPSIADRLRNPIDRRMGTGNAVLILRLPLMPTGHEERTGKERIQGMLQAVHSIPIEHHPAVHEVDANRPDVALPLTLLELVHVVSKISDFEQEVVATVTYMLRSGRIRLVGNFRDFPVEFLCD
jgi:hypothetical protein